MKKAGTDTAPKRERVPQAERRRVTRGKLLDATIESLIDVGYPRTTTVAISAPMMSTLIIDIRPSFCLLDDTASASQHNRGLYGPRQIA